MSRSFTTEDRHLLGFVRLIALPMPDGVSDLGERFKALVHSAVEAAKDIGEEKSLTCAYTQKGFEGVVVPKVVIVDMFLDPIIDAVRRHNKIPAKILTWYTSTASRALWSFAPEKYGGPGDLRSKVLEEVQRSGKPLYQVAHEILSGTTDEVRCVPGLPLMYDYESEPQQSVVSDISGFLHFNLMSVLAKTDGIICNFSEVMEPESVKALRSWYAESNKDVYVLGPLVPDAAHDEAAVGEAQQSAGGRVVEEFLGKMLQLKGQKSLLYISFGSIFWSTQPEKIWAFLDVVMEKKLPFIMSLASSFAKSPEGFEAKVAEHGMGLLSKWTPQQTILSHPVTGWFVSHCGQNGILESMVAGIPLVCWPYASDQGLNAAHLTRNLDAGYELFEVRTGDGLKPVYHLQGKTPTGTVESVKEEASAILDKAYGEDGEKKRANVKSLQEKILNVWSDDGTSTKELKALVEAFCA